MFCHERYVLESFRINTIMVVKILKDDLITFDPKKKHIAADVYSFEVAERGSEVLEMFDRNGIRRSDL